METVKGPFSHHRKLMPSELAGPIMDTTLVSSEQVERLLAAHPPVTKEEGDKMIASIRGALSTEGLNPLTPMIVLDSLSMLDESTTAARGQMPNVTILDDFGYVEVDPAEIEKLLDADEEEGERGVTNVHVEEIALPPGPVIKIGGVIGTSTHGPIEDEDEHDDL